MFAEMTRNWKMFVKYVINFIVMIVPRHSPFTIKLILIVAKYAKAIEKNMNDKSKLTEDLKVLETEVYNLKIDQKSIQAKLKISYDYETNLLERLEKCRKDRILLIDELNEKQKTISAVFKKMKSILNIFTGNFYD